MKNRGQNHKINQIISLSQNYKIHRQNVDTVKPAIDSLSKKRVQKVDKAATERLRYRQAVREHNNTSLARENQRITNRLSGILKEDRKKKPTQYSAFDTTYGLNKQSRSGSRSSKRLTSMSSQRSLTSVSSNFRQRSLRQKQIERENMKLAARITNPKSIKTLALKQLDKSYKKQQQIVKTRSRFSLKNQEIIRSLALQGLKFDRKDVQYLPQLSHKRRTTNIHLKSQRSTQKILP